MEKRFGSSLYGFRLPPSSTSLAAQNLRKKRAGKTPSEKKSFVETLRKQNHDKFNELYSGLQDQDDRVQKNGSIMDLLFDPATGGEIQKPKSAAKSLIDKRLLIPTSS